MAIRIIYDQTLFATANGDSAGWIRVTDVTQLVAGCTGFIYDADTNPVAIRVEAIDAPGSKLQLSTLQNDGSYLVTTLEAYLVATAAAVKIPQQAREDGGYVPPAGGAIAGIVAGSSTAGSGFVTFGNSNGVTFGMSNNVLTASVNTTVPPSAGGVAVSAGLHSTATGTVIFSNANGLAFGMDLAGIITGSYTLPPSAEKVFSNSNNVSFGLNGSTVTASASFSQTVQTQGLLTLQGSTGAINFLNANGLSFGGNNNTITASVEFPAQTVQTQNMVSIEGSTGNIRFSNSNGISFGFNNSTLTASYTVPAIPVQTVQPVAASASNGSYNFSTLKFVEGSGVTWATQAGGIQASVKTDYQSSNANYLTSQSNQAISGSNGSFAFQTLSLGASNGVSFYTTNGSIVASYTVPTVPGQTYQPGAYSGSNGSFTASTLSFGQSNGITFYTTNGSIVASYTVPAIPGATVFSNANNVSFGLAGSTITASATVTYPAQTVQPVAASASNGSYNFSTLKFAQGGGVTFSTDSNGINATIKTDYQSSNANYLTSQSNQAFSASGGSSAFQTLVFANSNNVTFSNSNGSVVASASFAQSTQPVAISGSNGSFAFSTLSMGNSNGLTFYTTNGSLVGSYTVPTTVAQSAQPVAASASNGSFAFSTLGFVQGSGVTWATQAGGIQASVKTDYQSSNANYLTSQSTSPAGIAIPGTTITNGTVQFANSNGVSFGFGTGTAASQITITVQPGAAAGVAAFSAGTAQATSGTIQFVNSNGVTFGMGTGASYGQITASLAPGAAAGIAAIGAGTQTATSGTQVFSNSNNVSFTMNGSSQIVASASFNQSAQPVAASASNGSYNFSTLKFVEGSGVTWATQVNGIQASVKTDYQSSNANYLTSQSNQALSGSNGSFAFQTASFGASNGATFYTTNGSLVVSYTVPAIPGATVFSNANNVTFGLAGSTITASATVTYPAQTVQPVAASASNGSYLFSTLKFAQGGGVTFSTDSNGINATIKTDYQSAGAYLTTAANSTHSHGNPTLALTNLTGTTASNSAGFTLSLSAAAPGGGGGAAIQGSGTYSQNTGTVQFANSNGVTFGLSNNGVMTASVQAGAAAGIGAVNAGTQTQTSGTLAFVNSNNITFGMSGSNQITASAAQSDLTVTNLTISQGTGASSTNITIQGPTFANSNGVTFGLSSGTYTASFSGGGAGGAAIKGSGTYSQNTGTVAFANSNNVSFGLSNNGTMTASFAQSVLTAGANITLSSNGSTISIIGGAGAGGGAAISAGTQSQNTGTVVFSNSNNMSFGLSAGTFTASAGQSDLTVTNLTISQGTGASSTNITIQGPTFANSNGVTFGLSNGTYTASVAGGGGGGAALKGSGTYSQNTGTVAFANSNNVTFGLSNNGTMTASFAQSVLTAGANITLSSAGSVISIIGGAGGAGGAGLSAGSQSVNTGTVAFANSHNVSFGMSGSNQITASFAQSVLTAGANITLSSNGSTISIIGGAGGAGGAAIKGSGTYAQGTGTVEFANSNGITFGLSNNGTMTASHNGLTTAANSTHSHGNPTLALTNLTGTTASNSAGFTLSLSAAAPGAGGGINAAAGTQTQTSGTLQFVNSNLVSFGMSNSSQITASFAQSVLTGGTNVTLSSGGSTISVIGPTFANANNVTFGVNGQSITASASYPAQTVQPVAASASNGSYLFSTLKFAQGGGVTFSTDSNGINATVKTDYQSSNANYLTSQSNQAFSASGGSSAFQTLVFANSNNITFSNSNGSVVASASFPAQTVQPVAVSGSNGSFAFSTITLGSSNGMHFYTTNGSIVGSYTQQALPGATVFSNSNNVTFGLNGSTITASASFAGGGAAISAAGGSANTGTIVFSNSNGISFGWNAGTITATVNPGAAAGIPAIGAGTQTATSGTQVFSNSNNVSFTMNGSSQIVASASFNQTAQPVAISGSNGSFAFSTLTMGSSNGMHFYTTNGSLVGSYAHTDGPSAIIGGTGTYTAGSVVFSGSGGITVTNNANTIIVSFDGHHIDGVLPSGNGYGTGFSSMSTGTFGINAVGALQMSQNANNISLSVPAQTVQPVAVSGSNGSFAFSTLTMGASNGLTFYTTNGSVVGSYTVPTIPGATVFSNSNNVTFGLNGSTVTASASFVAQTVQPVAASASNGSYLFSTLKFVEGSGVTWATQANGIQASVKTDYQSSNANYLTSQSNQAISGSNGSFAFQTASFGASNGATFYTTNGSLVVSYTVPNVPAQTVQPVAASASNGSYLFSTLKFAQGGGVTFSTDSNGINATVVTNYQTPGAYLTTAMASNAATVFSNVGQNITFGLVGSTITASAAGGGGGGGAGLSAGSQSVSTGTVAFANSNNVSFGMSGSNQITASFAQSVLTAGANITLSSNGSTISIIGAAGGGGGAGLSAGTQSVNTGTVAFANSNNVTFGMSGSNQITASFAQSVLTAGTNITLSSAGSTISVIGPTFANSNGITFGVNGQTITASVAGGGGAALGISTAGNTQGTSGNFSNGTYIFEGSNGLSVSQLTAATPGVQTLRLVAPTRSGPTGVVVNASASTLTSGNLVFSNSNGVSFGINGSTITADYDFTVSAANGSYATNMINFPATLGHTWSTGTQGIYLASDNDQATYYMTGANTTAQSSSGSIALYSQVFSGAGGVSVGMSGNTMVISGAGAGVVNQTGPNIAAGGVTVTAGTVIFSNSNNVSFGMAGSTLTASAAGGGAAYTALTYQNRQLGASTNTVAGQNSVWLIPMRIGAPVSASTLLQMVSITGSVTSNQTNTVGITMDVMLYKNTGTNLSQVDSVWSAQGLFTYYNSGSAVMSAAYAHQGTTDTYSSTGSAAWIGSVMGLKFLTFTIGSTLDTGLYAYGFRVSTSSAGNSSVLRSFNPVIDNPMPVANAYFGALTTTGTAQSIGYVDGGTYSTTSGAMPASFIFSQIRQTLNAVPYVKIGGA